MYPCAPWPHSVWSFAPFQNRRKDKSLKICMVLVNNSKKMFTFKTNVDALYATLVEATILLSVGFPEPLGSDLEWRIRIQINNSGSGFGSTSDQWCRQKSVLSSCSWMFFDKINLPSLLSFSAYFRGFKVVETKFIKKIWLLSLDYIWILL